jgi:replicative DNA helicase
VNNGSPVANLDAEQCVIASVLLDNAALDRISLHPSDFYWFQHRYCYEAMQRLHERREPIDFVTLANELTRLRNDVKADRLRRVDALSWDAPGPEYLSDLADKLPTPDNVAMYASIVIGCSRLRHMIEISDQIKLECQEYAGNLSPLWQSIEERIHSVTRRDVSGGLLTNLAVARMTAENLTAVDERRSSNEPCVRFGLRDVDEMIGRIGSELVIVPARSGMGKSAQINGIVRENSLLQDFHCLYWSCEVLPQDAQVNIVCQHAKMNARKAHDCALADWQWDQFVAAFQEMQSNLKVTWLDVESDWMAFVSAARRLHAVGKLDYIVCDHLHDMPPVERNRERRHELSGLVKALGKLTQELKLPIFVAAQLNRESDKRQGAGGTKPKLTDIRECGEIEQRADIVIAPYREGYYTKNPEDASTAQMIVLKRRNGEIGEVDVGWDGPSMRFYDLNRKSADDDLRERERDRAFQERTAAPPAYRDANDEMPAM